MSLICTVCVKSLTDPRILPCKHSFCLNCLKEQFSQSTQIKCPICEVSCDRPHDIDELPVNTFLLKLDKINRRSRLTLTKKYCGSCKEKRSKKYCMTCDHHFCSACLIHHDIIKTNQSHKLFNIDSPDYKEAMENGDYKICNNHNQKIDIYCKNCRDYICLKCSLFNHKQHDLIDIEEKVKEEKLKLELTIAQLKYALDVYNKELNKFQSTQSNEKDKVISDIKSYGNALKDEIDKYIQKLVDEAEKYDKEYLAEKRNSFYKEACEEKRSMEINLTLLESRLKHLRIDSIVTYDIPIPQWKPLKTDKVAMRFVKGENSVPINFKDSIGFIYFNPFFKIFKKSKN